MNFCSRIFIAALCQSRHKESDKNKTGKSCCEESGICGVQETCQNPENLITEKQMLCYRFEF